MTTAAALPRTTSCWSISSNAARQGFDPEIGVYIDDVYVSDSTGFNTALLDIERIEVVVRRVGLGEVSDGQLSCATTRGV